MPAKKYQYSSLDRKLAIRLSLIISFLTTFFTFARFFFAESHQRSEDFDLIYEPAVHHYILYFIGCALIFYLLYEVCFCIFRKKWGKCKKYFASFFATYSVSLLICLIILITALQFLQAIPDDMRIHLTHLLRRHVLSLGLIPSLIVFFSTFYISNIIRNQQTLLENQRLAAENIRNRHEALKNQLNPHFLFNSLNTLDGLIGFDNEKAHEYLQNLSLTFRYTIQNKEITTLKEELNFTETYACLMKIRYGENLNIQYALDEKYDCFFITPLSLQVLIENAIKHNVINDRHPLTIHIETTENDSIRVSNDIQPKINAEAGEGIGLANLVERYHLLFNKDVVITKNDVFSVEIPLIKQI